MKVDFFIIGAPKCGTTAMAGYLAEHPQICMSQPKEPWYFCSDMGVGKAERAATDAQYEAKYFKHYDADQNLRCGEGTPLYLFSKTAIQNILKYNPKARFIVMVRNPVEMAQSLHAQLVYNGVREENVADFEKAWMLQDERKYGKHLPQNCLDKSLLQYREVCSVGKQLERLFGLVDAHQVCLILFDDFCRDPQQSYLKVLKHIGIEPDSRSEFITANARKRWGSPFIPHVLNSITVLRKKAGFSRELGIRKLLLKYAVRPGKKTALSNKMKCRLVNEFKADVELLERIFKRDLSHWLNTETSVDD